MSARKPCLGYPSRTDAVMALLKRGETPTQIARRIEAESGETVTEKMVLALEESRRRQEQLKLTRVTTKYRDELHVAARIDRRRVIGFLRNLLCELEQRP